MPYEDSLDALRTSLAGSVLVPGHPEYDHARRCFNAHVDRRPAVIARCADERDIATALDFARAHDLEIAVRGGGHNPAGHCVCDDGLVVDLSNMRRVDVDDEARLAHAQGGATWLDFDTATLGHGLATPGGVVGSTGVCGLTLGGGIGHLTAQHGLTCDQLVAAELVTADGGSVRAGGDENPELLWALRGGGGNFGVVTKLTFRLYPVERVIGGLLVYRGSAGEVLRRFRDLTAGAGTELSCQAILSVDETRTPTVVVAPCYTGSNGDPTALAVLQSAPGLVEDGLRSQTFLEQQLLFDSPYGVNRHYWKGNFVRELSDELIDRLVESLVELGRPATHVLIESLHGAPKDVHAPEAALGYRDAAFNVSAMAVWADPELDEEHVQWARATSAAMQPWSMGGGYFNYMQADEPIERVRSSFGDEAFARLQALKARFDPSNVLHRNQNIPPVGAKAGR